MRVLHVIPSLLPESGGPSRSVPDLCRALAARGIDVMLLSTHLDGNRLTINPVDEPYEVVLLPAGDGTLRSGRQIYRDITQRARDFDVIHLHSMWNLPVTFAAAAARKVGVPYILAPRGMLSDVCLRQSNYALKRVYARSYDHRTVEGAALLHFLNADEMRASQNNWFQYPPHFLARNGIAPILEDLPRGMFRARFPEIANRPVILFLGRLHAIKGLDLQLEALRRVLPRHPDVVWVLVGPDDGEWTRLQSLIERSGLSNHVLWAGPIVGKERFSALVDADVVLQTSSYECQSVTVNEALAVGVPLVVTDSINYGEVAASGAGFVVRRDAEEIANAIDKVLSDQAMGDVMREAGRLFANDALAWPRIAGAVSAAYNEVLSAGRNVSEGWQSRPARSSAVSS